jgi:glycosyltransferase involved in cell wall biosynthesis
MKPFMSLCMIVKDEEKVLRRCLDSVKGIVDEIIIVDTGSSDNTKEIAKEYTDKLFNFKWNNNFSEARNYAASKAQGKWILVLDADEYVDPSNLQQAIEEVKNHNDLYDIYVVNIVNFAGENGENTVQHKHVRIYKNDGTIRFYRAIHEQLKKENDIVNVGLSSLIIYHSGYLSQTVKEKNKNERNLPLVQHELNQLTSKGFDYFNLGNELKRLGQTKEALDAYIKAYQNKEDIWHDWVPFCLCNMIECLIELKRYKDALEIIHSAEYMYTNVADFLFLKGEIYLQQHRYDDAKNVFNVIVSNKQNYSDVVRSADYRDYFPHRRLGRIYEMEKDYEKAVFHYVKALNFNNYCLESMIRLIDLLSKFHSEEEIYQFISKRLLKDNNEDFLRKILIFLLNQGLSKIAGLLVNHYFNDHLTIKKLVELKVDIINGNFEPYLSREDIESSLFLAGINLGLLDFADLFIMHWHMSDSFIKRCIEVIMTSSKIYTIVQYLKDKEQKLQIDVESYLYLVEKALRFKKWALLDELISIKGEVGEGIESKLGSIFYRNECEEKAIELYQLAAENSLMEQDYVNIIEWFLSSANYERAYKASKEALNRFDKDFRFYKYVILLGDQNSEYVQSVKLKAFSLFKDSEWLRVHF